MHACKYVCIYVCMYACMYVYTYVCMCVCIYVCLYVYIYVCLYLYVCIYVCMYACMRARVCVHVCMCVRVCVRARARVRVCVNISPPKASTPISSISRTSVAGGHSYGVQRFQPQGMSFRRVETRTVHLQVTHRLVGLVVKASATRAEDPGFESRLCRDFFGVES